MRQSILLFFALISLFIYGCNSVDPIPAAEASITFSKPYYLINEPIEITLETSNVRNVSWDFGNGVTSTSMNPIGKRYMEPGIYTISLTLTSLGGERSVITEHVTIGQYQAYEAVLHRAEGWQEGIPPTDVKVEVRRYPSEEPFWESAVIENVGFENLPVTFPLDDIPLGGDGQGFYSYPTFRFIDVHTRNSLAFEGGGTSYQYLENELLITSIGRYSIKYKLFLPQD